MYLNGRWSTSPKMTESRFPYTGEVVEEVSDTTDEQIEECLATAGQGTLKMAQLSAAERCENRDFSWSGWMMNETEH
jgi:acyl-CoA reductase-like NAD-dependent aldehyde dehydrogenase